MNRLFALTGFSYLIMLAACFFIPQIALICLLATVMVGFTSAVLIKKSRQGKIFPIVLLTCILAISAYLLNFNTNIRPTEKYDGQDILVSGEICDLPYKQNNTYYYILNVEQINKKDVRKFKIRMSSPKAIETDVYDKFTGTIHIFQPENSAGFNSKIFYRSKNIYAHAFLYDHMEYSVQTTERKPFYYHALKLREKMLNTSKTIFPPRIATLINGILLNERHELPEDVKNNFSVTGIYHLLATAGIHVAILSQFFLLFFKKFRLNQRIAPILTATAVFIFMAITCFTPSIARAGIMAIIYLLGLAFFKKSDSVNSLGFAILLMCIVNPNSALDISLWMSFLATLGAILSSNKIELWFRKKLKLTSYQNKFLNYILSVTSMTTAVIIFSLPLSAWFFKKTSLIAVFSNVLLIWPASILLNAGMLTQIIHILNFPEFLYMPTASLCGFCANFILFCSEKLAMIPFAQISLDYGFINLWLAFLLVLIAITVLFGVIKNKIKLAMILSLNILLAGIFSYQIYIKDITRITVVNCGDGLCLTFHKNQHTSMIFFDTEKTYSSSINDSLAEIYPQKLDYLQILNSKTPENEDLITKTIKTYKPEVLILPVKNNLVIEDPPQNTMYFKDYITSDFWGNINVQTLKINDKIYMHIKISDTTLLICANGGNTEDIPNKWQKCDFLITSGLPLNYKNLHTKQMFLSMDKEFSKIIIPKFSNKKNIISTAYHGTIYIDISASGEANVRRSR